MQTKEESDNELEDYISEGQKYLKTLDEKVAALETLKKGLEEGKSVAEIDHSI